VQIRRESTIPRPRSNTPSTLAGRQAITSAHGVGINYSSHVTDNGYLSRNLPVQRLTLLDGLPAPTATSGKASLFIDSADGSLKVMFASGIVKTLALDS